MYICICKGIRSTEVQAIIGQSKDIRVETIQSSCGAGTDCGACVDRLKEMVNRFRESAVLNNSEVQPVR